jgi:hypothetical protein
MDIKKILTSIVDNELKNMKGKGELIGVGKWESNVVVSLFKHTVLVVIPEIWFLIDTNKIIKKDISTNMIESLLKIDANTVQVYPTPNTVDYNKGVCRVFEGKDLTTYIDTKLLRVLYDSNKDGAITFYTKNNKSPVIVKNGDIILGCVCPVNIKQGGN